MQTRTHEEATVKRARHRKEVKRTNFLANKQKNDSESEPNRTQTQTIVFDARNEKIIIIVAQAKASERTFEKLQQTKKKRRDIKIVALFGRGLRTEVERS
jgi:hypothetical protein